MYRLRELTRLTSPDNKHTWQCTLLFCARSTLGDETWLGCPTYEICLPHWGSMTQDLCCKAAISYSEAIDARAPRWNAFSRLRPKSDSAHPSITSFELPMNWARSSLATRSLKKQSATPATCSSCS